MSSYANPENYKNLILKSVVKKFDWNNLKYFADKTVEEFKDSLMGISISRENSVQSLHNLDTFVCLSMVEKDELNKYGKVYINLLNPLAVANSVANLLIYFLLEQSNHFLDLNHENILELDDLSNIYEEIQEYLNEISVEHYFFNECFSTI